MDQKKKKKKKTKNSPKLWPNSSEKPKWDDLKLAKFGH